MVTLRGRGVRTLRAGAALSSVLVLMGCAEILDIPDTETLELAPSGPWRCVEVPPGPMAPSAPTAVVRFQACDFISSCGVPVTGLSARVCDKLDVGCINPRSAVVRDNNGLLELEVPTGPRGFDGYVEVSTDVAPCFDADVFGSAAGLACGLVPECDPSAPTAACDIPVYFPVMWFFNPPVVADLEQPIPLQMYPTAALPPLLEAAGGMFAPGTGSVFLTALDCDGRPASGVTFELAEHQTEAASLYIDSGVISNTAAETDASGVGGFIRIPPGFIEVKGINREGKVIGEVGALASPTFATYGVLVPSFAE